MRMMLSTPTPTPSRNTPSRTHAERAWRLRTCFLVAALLALAPAARADGPLPPRIAKAQIQVELASDVTAVAPGEVVHVGVVFKPEPGWHLYWMNPGDTGQPTEVTFEGPDGLDFGSIAWPLPTRFIETSGTFKNVTYGYGDEVILQATARVPESVAEGSELALEAKTKWLVCKENCVQGNARLGLTLRVSTADRKTRTSDRAAAFEAAMARVPLDQVAAARTLTIAETGPAAPVRPGGEFVVTVHVTDRAGQPVDPAGAAEDAFFPATRKGLKVSSIATNRGAGGGLDVTIKGRASDDATLVNELRGVVVVQSGGARVAFEATLPVPREPGPVTQVPVNELPSSATTLASAAPGDVCDSLEAGSSEPEGQVNAFLVALLFAFLGGLILNVMPCVLPILSLKVLSLVEQAHEDPRRIWRHGLVYTAGVLASFLALAIVLIAIQAKTSSVGLQSPTFVMVLTGVIFAFALSLFGVFELALPFASRLDQTVARSHGYASSFNYGIFAVLLGTPCTAPFLGPALGYALTQPPLELVTLMLAVGLGMAFPFLLVARFPAWRRLIPKPGPWLETFKKAMGFLILGTAVFLLSTLSEVLARGAFMEYLVFLAALALAAWIYGHWANPARSRLSRSGGALTALALTVLVASRLSGEAPPPPSGTFVEGGITWRDFDQLDVEKAAADGTTVFIDFTASWCTTCKVNEATAIHTDRVRDALAQLKVVAVKADYSVEKPKITEWLARFRQPSVPLYVVIPAGNPAGAFALPTLLSTDDVLRGLCRAGPSRTTTARAL